MVTLDDKPVFIDTNVLVYANILAYPFALAKSSRPLFSWVKLARQR